MNTRVVANKVCGALQRLKVTLFKGYGTLRLEISVPATALSKNI